MRIIYTCFDLKFLIKHWIILRCFAEKDTSWTARRHDWFKLPFQQLAQIVFFRSEKRRIPVFASILELKGLIFLKKNSEKRLSLESWKSIICNEKGFGKHGFLERLPSTCRNQQEIFAFSEPFLSYSSEEVSIEVS